MVGLFPPPPAAANVFPGFDCTCTGLTAYAGKSLVMQWIVRDVMFPDDLPYVFFFPVEKWVDLDQPKVVIP
jgi:hypothetical protein